MGHHKHNLDLDMNLYRASKFVYLERHIGMSLQELNANIMSKIRRIHWQVLANLQSLAMIDPPKFAYAWKKEPGYTVLVRGEVVYIIKCTPVQVLVRTTTYCGHELPVSYLNELCFMIPRSHVLTRHVERVTSFCTSLYPVKYRL